MFSTVRVFYFNRTNFFYKGKKYDYTPDTLIDVLKKLHTVEKLETAKIILGEELGYVYSYKIDLPFKYSRENAILEAKKQLPLEITDNNFDWIKIRGKDKNWYVQTIAANEEVLDFISKSFAQNNVKVSSFIPASLILSTLINKPVIKDGTGIFSVEGLEKTIIVLDDGITMLSGNTDQITGSGLDDIKSQFKITRDMQTVRFSYLEIEKAAKNWDIFGPDDKTLVIKPNIDKYVINTTLKKPDKPSVVITKINQPVSKTRVLFLLTLLAVSLFLLVFTYKNKAIFSGVGNFVQSVFFGTEPLTPQTILTNTFTTKPTTVNNMLSPDNLATYSIENASLVDNVASDLAALLKRASFTTTTPTTAIPETIFKENRIRYKTDSSDQVITYIKNILAKYKLAVKEPLPNDSPYDVIIRIEVTNL
jgi:hypothetical protein